MKLLLFFSILIMMVMPVLAGTIHGTVYDLNLDKVAAIVEVNSTPQQRMVAVDGDYSFALEEGSYLLTARLILNNVTEANAEEEVTVIGEQDAVLDLILFPVLDDDLVDDLGDIDVDTSGLENPSQPYVGIILILVAIAILIVWYKRKPKQEKDDLQKLMDFIKRQGGRTTQKDIRKEFPQSEAKISLMITELEHNGKIQKIKKGRGNVIILK